MEVLEVVAAVITDDLGRVLACRRRPGIASGGRWEFPGGKIEPGEGAEAALVREIAEELGVEIEVREHLSTDDTLVGDRIIRLACYRALSRGPISTSTDHDELRWIDASALTELVWAAPDIPVVRLLSAR